MLLNPQTTYYQNQIDGAIERQYGAEQRVTGFARQLFQTATRRGRMSRLRHLLIGSPLYLRDLMHVLQVRSLQVNGGRSLGLRTVTISAIVGSEGRTLDFDRDFNPLQSHTAYRWQRVATAREEGIPLPPVELVRVGDEYYVRDGHHRISVARALGQHCIEATVYAL